MMTNIYSEGDFEAGDDPPAGSYSFMTSGLHFNYTYSEIVAEGSYAAQGVMDSRGSTSDLFTYHYLAWQDYPVGSEMFLNVSYYLKNVDFVNDSMWHEVRVSLRNSTNNYVLYYVTAYSSGAYFSNYSWGKRLIRGNASVGVWNTLHVDLASDVDELFGGELYVDEVVLALHSRGQYGARYEAIWDNVILYNSTMANGVSNGGFESGSTDWSYSGSDPGYAGRTTTHVNGDYGYKLYAATPSESTSRASLEVSRSTPDGFTAYQPGLMRLRFYWMYNDTSGGGSSQRAFLTTLWYNDSHYVYIYFYLGRLSNSTSGYSNSSSYVYLFAPGFGTRNQWNYFDYDFYDVLNEIGFRHSSLTMVQLRVDAGGASNSTATLFIDDFELVTYPLMDYGFEVDWWSTSNSEVTLWDAWSGNAQENRLSTVSHSGSYSYNATPSPFELAELHRSMAIVFPAGSYTDFWFQLVDPLPASYYASIILRIDRDWDIHYVLATTNTLTNTTYDTYFVLNYTTTGQWINLVRDINKDIAEAYPSVKPIVTDVFTYVVAGSESFSVLFDDMGFVRD